LKEGTKISAIGLMSGTSLDGLDIAAVDFFLVDNNWQFELKHATTLPYLSQFKSQLREVYHLSSFDLAKLHHDFGVYCAKAVNEFLSSTNHKPSFIASHGQTIFHRPELGFTTQIGSGAAIAALTSIDTITDFRSKDVALGGNGAPLVPLVDELLFNQYEACLNLGGFANISFSSNNSRVAYDICAANLVLNALCNQLDLDYDKDGAIAASHPVNHTLLEQLNQLEYFQKSFPKSLGFEFVDQVIMPLLQSSEKDVNVQIATFTKHIADRIIFDLNKYKINSLMVSGGGAYNKKLMGLIKEGARFEINIPSDEIIEFKEAICFAFLGLLRYFNEPNTLASVTGAIRNSVGACIYSGR
jgi:anhydro-N-acetylmuramic acid kinase